MDQFFVRGLRENAADLQDFWDDLKEWGASMKQKEESFKTDDGKGEPSNKTRKTQKAEEKKYEEDKAIDMNYNLEREDCGGDRFPLESDNDIDWNSYRTYQVKNQNEAIVEKEKVKSQDEAIAEKEKGNKFVREQNWDEAIKCYTKAIDCYSHDPIFYANRALCYLKICKFKEAEYDCTQSIKLDATYVKAYQRRAAAKEALKRFDEAESDILRALELEPKNKESRASLERLRNLLAKSEKGEPSNKTRKTQKVEEKKYEEDKAIEMNYNLEREDCGGDRFPLESDNDFDWNWYRTYQVKNQNEAIVEKEKVKSQDEAIAEKGKGNKFVREQNWDEAIKCYTKAIDCYSHDPIFYANRALCYLKICKFKEAEYDCAQSIKLDATYVKAYQRRAAAKEALKRFDEAEYDILRALELEPENKECRASLERLRNLLAKSEKSVKKRPVSKFTASRNKVTLLDKQRLPPEHPTLDSMVNKTVDTSRPLSIWPEQNDIILVKPINKPPHLRSKKPIKRIEISEVDTINEKNNMGESTLLREPEAVKMHVIERKQIEKQESEKPTNKLSSTIKDQKNTSNINISNIDHKICVKQQENDLNITAPKTSVQFYLTWRNLKNVEDKYKYLKMIQPHDLPNIFLHSLETDIFSNILEVLVKHFITKKDKIFDILHNISEVKRFSTITMFKTSLDVHNLWKLFDYIKETEDKTKEDVDMLIKKYEL